MTCQFSYKGVSVEDCINLCNEETNNLCGSYCENKCKNCQDITKCPWILNTTTLSPTTTTGSPIYNKNAMDELLNRIMNYSRTSDMLLETPNNLSEDLGSITQINDDATKRNIIYMYLTGMYNINTQILSDNYDENKNSMSNYNKKKHIINNNETDIKLLIEELKVKDREYKINLGNYTRMVFETQSLKYLLFMVLVLFVVPLLYLMGLLPKLFAVIIYLILLAISIGFIMYRIHLHSKGRDSIFYNKYNFDKPTNENILKSHIKQTLDPECKKDLNNDTDDFDPKDIDIGSISSWKNKLPSNNI